MEDDIKRILQDKQFHLQLKSEQNEITQNVLERRFNGSVTHRLRKEHVLRSPSHFGQGKKIIYANHQIPRYIAVIVVFSKSRDKCLKVKVR